MQIIFLCLICIFKNINENVKQLWKNHKKALSDAFSYTIDDTIATKIGGGGGG